MQPKPILPPTYFLVAILLMVGLHFLLPIRQVVVAPYRYLGIALILAGVAVNFWSSNLFDKAKTTVKPFEQSSDLVTEGPFRFSRHPMYVGMVVLLAGLAVLLGSVTPVLVIPPFAWIVKRFADVEEKAMEETFGDAYRQYSKRVRRWV